MNPVTIGGAFQRNVTSVSFNPSVALPSGALLFLSMGTNAPNTANITIADTVVGPNSTKNAYGLIVNSQQPATSVTLWVFLVIKALALATTDTITLTSNTQADYALSGYYFPTGDGSLLGSDVEWFNSTTPHYQVFAQSGMQLFALLGVAGPSTDTFTQDAAWGPDVPSGITTTTFTVRACGRTATSGTGQYTWSPTLQTARQSVGFVCSFK